MKTIQFLYNEHNEKAVQIAQKLQKSNCKVVLKPHYNVPIIWIDDHCFTGLEAVDKAVKELILTED